ncbi:regulatory protein RecX [Raineya sp.]
MEKKVVSVKEALQKMASWCAYQERSQYEVRKKLKETYLLDSEEMEWIIAELITQGYINEERFAKTFAGGKFRIKKWGKRKIRQALQMHHITEYCIKEALKEIPDEDYEATVRELLIKKNRQISERNPLKRKQKLAYYAIGKGFESDIVWDIVNEMV